MKKSVLITGSSKGLGRELARTLFSRGYNIIIHGRDEQALEKLRRECRKKSQLCDVVVGDLREESIVDGLGEIAEKRNLDVLINNAGVYLNKKVEETSYEEYRKMMDVNFFAPVRLIKMVLPIFRKKGMGLIININSVAGKQGYDGESAYCASKSALRGFSEALKYEVTNRGIGVIDVYSGAIATQMIKGRKDPMKCIDPKEASEVITNLREQYPTVRVNEITLNRRIY